MSHDMRVAIRVAADYAEHLHRDDGVPKRAAVLAAARAVVRAHRADKGLGLGEGEKKGDGAGWMLEGAILLSGLAAGGRLLGLVR